MFDWRTPAAVGLFILLGIAGSLFLFGIVGIATLIVAGGKVTFLALLFGSTIALLHVNSRLTWGKNRS